MHVVMTPVGSAGDVLPHVALGRALAQRGHEVVVLANEHFRRMVEGADLEFVEVGTAAWYAEILEHPDLWNPHRAGQLFLECMLELMPRTFQAVLERARPGESVLVCASGDFGALAAGEKVDLSVLRLAVEPINLLSAYNPLVTTGLRRLDWVPIWLRKSLISMVRAKMNRDLGARLGEFRRGVGLPPLETSIWAWWHAPPAIGLFPEWFAPYRPDWSASTRLTGFLRYRREDAVKAPRELADFIEAGRPPLIFTVASFNKQASEYFSAAVQVSESMGRRAMLVTPHRAQIPAHLPENVVHFDYAPFTEILPRCAVLVHNGGIGTLVEALGAGIPQLIVPNMSSHFDHAIRLSDLRAGDYIVGRELSGRSLRHKLTAILEDEAFRQNAQRCSELIARQDALGETCRLVENLGEGTTFRG
jgi:rhamnosyltransferase subunit B